MHNISLVPSADLLFAVFIISLLYLFKQIHKHIKSHKSIKAQCEKNDEKIFELEMKLDGIENAINDAESGRAERFETIKKFTELLSQLSKDDQPLKDDEPVVEQEEGDQPKTEEYQEDNA